MGRLSGVADMSSPVLAMLFLHEWPRQSGMVSVGLLGDEATAFVREARPGESGVGLGVGTSGGELCYPRVRAAWNL